MSKSHEYRDHAFVIDAVLEDGVWKGRFRLLGDPSNAPPELAQKYTWVPMDDGWATANEAVMNAEEAAHAAIDALFGVPARIEG